MVLLLILLATATTIVLPRTISRDGYGSRPIPPSHPGELPPHHLR